LCHPRKNKNKIRPLQKNFVLFLLNSVIVGCVIWRWCCVVFLNIHISHLPLWFIVSAHFL
jgi:hypothetical protein